MDSKTTKTTEQATIKTKALVTVFDDLDAANQVVEALHAEGFSLDDIELVAHSLHEEAPQIDTPANRETTGSAIVANATKWASVGAGFGALAGFVTAFPGFGLGMILVGGLTGAVMGGVVGMEHAIEDDSVDLPTLKEYERIVENGECLVVVLGNHDDVMRAERIVNKLPTVHSHIHSLHGHEFHEHPAI